MRFPLVSVLAVLVLGSGCSSTPGGTGGGGGKAGTAGTGGTGAGGSSGGHGGSSGGGRDGGPIDAPAKHDGAGTSNGPCWSVSDCASGATCTVPGGQVCGGACLAVMHPCSLDTDCAGGDAAAPSICDPVACSCPAGKGCQPGCGGDNDCAPEMKCGSDHRCAPRPCTAASGSCPTDFTCGSAGTCARKSCNADTECSNACVEGACYGSPGICRLPVP